MPASRDVGQNIGEMTKAHPGWPRKRIVAASLNMAREMGADVKPAPKRKRKRPSKWAALAKT